MSSENLKQNLDAVEHALKHFADSLNHAGFKEGATTYQQMAGIVIGQRLWVETESINKFDSQFQRIAGLATEIHTCLAPYLGVMEKLGSLQDVVPPKEMVDSDSISERILTTLKETKKPMSATAIRAKVGISSSKLKRELNELAERKLISKVSVYGRSQYTV